MPRTLAEVEAWEAAHPRRDNGQPWATPEESWCEANTHEAGGFTETFPTAYAAAKASGPLATDKTIVPGHIYYFRGGSGNAGHDCFGTSRGLLMVSSVVPGGKPGYVASVDTYLRAKPFMTYLGHTARHGTQTLAGVSGASLGSSPLNNTTGTSPTSKGIDMTWARDTMVIRNKETGGIVALEPFALNDWGGNLTALDNAGMSAGQPQVDGHYWIDLDGTTYSVYVDQHKHHLNALRTLLASAAGSLNVDEGALAADLAKLLPGVSKPDLSAAVQQIITAIPTTFTAK